MSTYFIYLSDLPKRQGYTKRQSLYGGASLKNTKVTKTKTIYNKIRSNKYKTNNKDNSTKKETNYNKTMYIKLDKIKGQYSVPYSIP